MGVGRDHRAVFVRNFTDRNIIAGKFCLKDVFRCRSAAAAEYRRPVSRHLLHRRGKLIGIDIVNGLSTLASRQSRIWVDEDRGGGHLRHIFHKRQQLDRPETTV